MKEITINGVEYKPATALAKEFKYTTDYIGQLCRAKKVDAQLIGRSWYVNPLSLKNHKKSRYNNTKPTASSSSSRSSRQEVADYEIVTNEQDLAEKEDFNGDKYSHKVKISRRAVEPFVSKSTVRMNEDTEKNFAKRMDWKPLRYESDEQALLPTIKPVSTPKRLHVELAGSTDIPIKKATKITYLESEPLPTVSLSGSLKILSLDESFDEVSIEETSAQLLPIPAFEAEERKSINHPPLKQVLKMSVNTRNRIKKAGFAGTSLRTVTSFTPDAVKSDLLEDEDSYQVFKITLFTTSGILVASLLLLIFGESVVSATAATYQSEVGFTAQALTALLSLFSF
jgi:hypothetical protein